MNGYGKLYDENNYLIYQGEFKDNKPNGQGTLYNQDPKLNWKVYEGEFLEGKKHGVGKMTFSSSDIYFGEFENDILSGFGTYYRNGVTQIGLWKGE